MSKLFVNLRNVQSNKNNRIPLYFVCIYLFLMIDRPWESISYLNGYKIQFYFAIFMVVVSICFGCLKIVQSSANLWIFGLLFAHFFMSPFSFNADVTYDRGVEYAKLILVYVLMIACCSDEEDLYILVKAFVISMMIYVAHSFWEYGNGKHIYRMGMIRMIGVGEDFSDPNAFSASIVISFPIVWAVLRVEIIKYWRKALQCYLIIGSICVILTGSRSAYIALFLLFSSFLITSRKISKISAISVFLAIILATWIFLPSDKKERVQTIWDEDVGQENAHTSAQGRIEGFKAGWEMFIHSPIIGIGPGNFVTYRVEKLDGIALQPHNLYGQILGEMGIVGVILFGGLVFSIYRSCFKVSRYLKLNNLTETFAYGLAKSIMTSLVLLLIFGISGHNFYRPMWLWLGAWASILLRILLVSATINPEKRS